MIENNKNRRSIRLEGYDYSSPGAYFVTICTNDRSSLWGDVVDGEMNMNSAGMLIDETWKNIPVFYPGIEIDFYQIMPNHFHGVIIINNDFVGADPCVRPVEGQVRGPAPTKTKLYLPEIVRRFKTITTKRYIDGVKNYSWPTFQDKLWQRNYYEHIIRNEDELNRIREYVLNNPLTWEEDRENPYRMKSDKMKGQLEWMV